MSAFRKEGIFKKRIRTSEKGLCKALKEGIFKKHYFVIARSEATKQSLVQT